MTLIDTQNTNLNDFENPKMFMSKLDALHQQLPHILEDFIKYYIRLCLIIKILFEIRKSGHKLDITDLKLFINIVTYISYLSNILI